VWFLCIYCTAQTADEPCDTTNHRFRESLPLIYQGAMALARMTKSDHRRACCSSARQSRNGDSDHGDSRDDGLCGRQLFAPDGMTPPSMMGEAPRLRRHVTACMQALTNVQITARLPGRDLAAQGAPGGPARATVHTFLFFGVSGGAVPLMPPCQVHQRLGTPARWPCTL
jgi:hypothetical protein